MDSRSWWTPEPDPAALSLPADLRARDRFGARDCGWVNQMRPFVRHFAAPGARVLDPFCGFGTTLVAAALEGRQGIGTDIDADRIALSRERLARLDLPATLHHGSLPTLPSPGPIDLCLTSVPYFGCRWPDASADPEQLYRADDYASYLAGLRDVFHAVRGMLVDDGYCIAMAENVVIGGRMIPMTWDLGRLLGSLFVACEERILCYPAPAEPLPPGTSRSNRSHEYALIFRKQRETIDLAETDAELHALEAAGFRFALHGSFARWRDNPASHAERPPADADLIVPADEEHLNRMLVHLRGRGFVVEAWGRTLPAAVTLDTVRAHHYLRADRRAASGALIRLDLMLAERTTDASGNAQAGSNA